MNKIEERLEKLGFGKAANIVKDLKERERKMMIAYEHYRFVKQEKIDVFNDKLRKEAGNGSISYKRLAFKNIKEYEKVPPEAVLVKLEEAVEKKCFDSFEIAYIEEVHDPILFGRVDKCPDRFFISQWDNDVSIEEILTKVEG